MISSLLALFAADMPAQTTHGYDDLSDIPLTRWMSPDDERPMTYSEYLAMKGPAGPFEVTRLTSQACRDSGGSGRVLLVLVQTSLYTYIQDELATYMDDISREGFSPEICLSTGGTPEDIRNFLISDYFDVYGSAFAGVLLVGDFPVPWYDLSGDQFPTDLYYMDLDGTFLDGNGDGMFDGHEDNTYCDTAPDIFLGRLHVEPISGNDILTLENYFDKVHAYRTGSFSVPELALGFCDDDWANWGNYGLDYSFENVTIIDDIYETSAGNYEDKLDDGYHWIHTMAHSYSGGHHFSNSPGDGWVYNYEVKAIDPWALFYNLFACSNCRYTEPDYMGGVYIFCDTHGLAAVGCTKSGSMLSFEYFYGPMHRNVSIGDAYRTWWEAMYPYDSGNQSWFYGMTLLGDPTLVPRAGFYNDPQTGPSGFTQYEPVRAASPQTGAGFGGALAFGDINNDGHQDIICGVPGSVSGGHKAAGSVEIAYGPGFTIRDEVTAATPAPGERFGCSVETGDMNGDGICDVAVGVPGRDVNGNRDVGAVRIIHGPSLSSGPEIVPSSVKSMTAFGSSLVLFDFNSDLSMDIAVGGPGYNNRGLVEVFEGPGFTSYIKKNGDHHKMCEFGACLAAGDVDGDGDSDLLVGVPRGYLGDYGDFVLYFSPALTRKQTADPDDIPVLGRLGSSVAMGDFDGDGYDEIAVGVPGRTADGQKAAGSVMLFKLDAPELLLWKTLNAPIPEMFAEFGASLAAGDLTGDGCVDLCVGAPFADSNGMRDTGRVYLFTGPDLNSTSARLFKDFEPERNSGFGSCIEAGDLLSETPTLAISAPRASSDPYGTSVCHAGKVMLNAFMLQADAETISWQNGDSLTFDLNAGDEQAGNTYITAISASGTLPGTPFGSVVVPLNFDQLTGIGFNYLNSSVFHDFGGSLDGEGKGNCSFNLPPAVPNAQGARLYFAFFTLSPIDFASNPVMVDIE